MRSEGISTGIHCVYVRRCYISLASEHPRKIIYECINSCGFRDPCPCVEYDSPAVIDIFEITVNDEKPLMYRCDEKAGYHGTGCETDCCGRKTNV